MLSLGDVVSLDARPWPDFVRMCHRIPANPSVISHNDSSGQTYIKATTAGSYSSVVRYRNSTFLSLTGAFLRGLRKRRGSTWPLVIWYSSGRWKYGPVRSCLKINLPRIQP